MIDLIKGAVWSQFGASIDALKDAIELCPPEIWEKEQQFWYIPYHCLIFLDYYLTLPPKGFSPPPPFDLAEFEDRLPDRVYTKDELLEYLAFCREKCRTFIEGMTEEVVMSYWTNESGSMHYQVIEILLYNLRHVQHHAAQVNLLLRQTIDDAPGWVFRAEGG